MLNLFFVLFFGFTKFTHVCKVFVCIKVQRLTKTSFEKIGLLSMTLSLEISKFFYQSDFTWNRCWWFWQFQNLWTYKSSQIMNSRKIWVAEKFWNFHIVCFETRCSQSLDKIRFFFKMWSLSFSSIT